MMVLGAQVQAEVHFQVAWEVSLTIDTSSHFDVKFDYESPQPTSVESQMNGLR